MSRYRTSEKRNYANAYKPRGNLCGGLWQISAEDRAKYMADFESKHRAKKDATK